jgi:hypothetical protein
MISFLNFGLDCRTCGHFFKMGRGGFSKKGGRGGKSVGGGRGFGGNNKGKGGNAKKFGGKKGSKPKRRSLKGKSPKGGKENKVFGAMIMEKKMKKMDMPVKSSDLKDDYVPKGFQEFQRRMMMGSGKYPSTAPDFKKKKNLNKNNEKKIVKPRLASESVSGFMARVDKETRQNVVEEIRASKTASASTKKHHQQVKLREQLKKQEHQLDRKEKELFRDYVPFGEVADRPPEIQVRPKIKQKAIVVSDAQKRTNDILRDRMILAYNNSKRRTPTMV